MEVLYVRISCSVDIWCIDEYSGRFNTEMTKQTSLWVSTGWVQFSAFWSACWRGFYREDSVGALWQVENKYTLLGGIIGHLLQ